MTAHSFALFDTAIGRCGIAWGEGGVAGVQLPEAGEAETRARMLHRFPAAGETAPPPEVQCVVERIIALLGGEADDLAAVALDMNQVPEFHRRVYEVARTIPPGMTLSYGDIAARIGSPGAARAVGQALGRNPFPSVVPCPRVLGAGRHPHEAPHSGDRRRADQRRDGAFARRGGVGVRSEPRHRAAAHLRPE